MPQPRLHAAIGIAVLVAGVVPRLHAQPDAVNGIRPVDLRAHAIVDATVVTRPGEVLEGATIVIRNGTIERVGREIDVPGDARVWPGHGLRVYAGLIEPALLVDVDAGPDGIGDHWSGLIRPQRSAADRAVPDARRREQLRELGFTAAAVYPEDGILRGSGVVVALAGEADEVLAYRNRAALAASFDTSRGFGGGYPGSLMGSIALMRQTLLDARWHAECRAVYERHPEGNEPPIRADALVALEDVLEGRQAVIFDVRDELYALRAARVAEEFGVRYMLLGGGTEYRRLDAIEALDVPVIVPLQFPDRPDLSTLAASQRVSLRDMVSWEQAPANAARLVDAGVTVALTTHRLDKLSSFHSSVHDAIRHGLDEDHALAALTTVPAGLLGLDDVLGTVEPGKAANLVVVDGTLFDKKPKIRDVWVNGRRHQIDAPPDVELVASGTLRTDTGLERPITIDTTKKKVSVDVDDEKVRAKKVVVQQDRLSFTLDGTAVGATGYAFFSGVIDDDVVTGSGAMPDGTWFSFSIDATRPIDDDAEIAAAGTSNEGETAASSGDDERSRPEGDAADPSGRWAIRVHIEAMDESMPSTLEIERDADGRVEGRVSAMGEFIELTDGEWDAARGRLRFQLMTPHSTEATLVATVAGDSIDGTIEGQAFAASFTGDRDGAAPPSAAVASGADDEGRRDDESDDPEDAFEMPPSELVTPLGAYGLASPPETRRVLVENATIWTCGPAGILQNASMLVADGKIEAIYREGDVPDDLDAERLDAGGKHVTPGLIDCHSHTGIDGGVNEGGQTNTAEVRIGDVIDPDDINWYRQLAGGLTAANQLHGSANPIGGQNSVVKLKWSGGPDDFRVDDAIEGIKFALGENVKRRQNRYPNTRMGVEAFIRDAFTAARDYRDAWDRYRALPSEERSRTMPPRRDLELETLVEILEGDRLIHCHSYRQDEILMLIRLADELGFTIGTLQHVLEGYKVADAIAEHGAGASSFSDWWAYKMEVMDAIPHNGALMADQGVVVSFNSDSSELARRMNTEASKAVRYGGMEPHEALKLVTLNPARQLRIDHRTGSLEAGKDADFVIWSDDPLSTYARCEQTWIEGARYFDLELDRSLRERDHAERQRLVQKILAQTHGAPSEQSQDEQTTTATVAATAQVPGTADRSSRLLERLLESRRRWMEEQVRRGMHPDEIRPGRCACNDEWWFMMLGGWAQEEMDR